MNDISRRVVLRVLSWMATGCNTFMMVAGLLSISVTPGPGLDLVIDAVMVATFAVNLVLVIACHVFLDVNGDALARSIHRSWTGYLVCSGISVLASTILTMAFMIDQVPGSPVIVLAWCIAATAILATFLLALLACTGVLRSLATGTAWRTVPYPNGAGWSRLPLAARSRAIALACLVVLVAAFGTWMPAIFFTGGSNAVAFVAGNLSFTVVLLLVPLAVLLVRSIPTTGTRSQVIATIMIAVVLGSITAVNLVPITRVNETVRSLDDQFTAAFGTGWNDVALERTPAGLRTAPFVLHDNVFTMVMPHVDQDLDIEYSVSNGTSLRFDWYAPAGTRGANVSLPVIIALHPGSWQLFDKGVANIFPVSRYLASKGFVVVDTQYGLYPSFSMRDMIHHVGLLTGFLEVNAATYNVNVSRSFFLGRSAGAHLSLVSGFGYTDPFFSGSFAATFACLGIIQYYAPANMSWLTPASEALVGVPPAGFPMFDPVQLVGASSPPVLTLQGDADRLVHPSHAIDLQATMDSYNRTCITGIFHHGGHAFDAFYNYFHNQVALYYMERFLLLVAG